jgi:hypothetical protein
MVTRQQHTVWRAYLSEWAQGEKLWCAMEGRVFRANPKKVGRERDFYEVREVRESDLEILRASLIRPIKHDQIREMAEEWVETFTLLQRLRPALEASGCDARKIQEIGIQLEESLHGKIEDNATPLLRQLLSSDRFCLQGDDEYFSFMHYLMTQYFRTSRIKENLHQNLDVLRPGYVERTMGIMRHVLPLTATWKLINERSAMPARILTNRTLIPFITGDQPVINTHAADVGFEEMVDVCEFYYPLSPERAVIISSSDVYSSGQITEDTAAIRLNKLIALSAEKQIYASSSEDLQELQNVVGTHRR